MRIIGFKVKGLALNQIGASQMKFTKTNGRYVATRKDGQVITIEKSECNTQWVVRYEGDWDGDNTDYASTKKALVDMENRIEANL